ncbi:hypothetical protein CANINC_003271 [Pichia inconspicua]|uniref:Uncharacterized protein n=1 Tax=Pichia inconspicua TaxID=52247 RepID=A0A4V4NFI7_9ASCO|nr:hypothetical protein CANINC_003271 [[Candida] inconspicua]
MLWKNETPEQRIVVINNVTSQYLRDLVDDLEDPLSVPRAEYLGYDIKARPVLCHHSTLDIMRVLKPDYMHVYYENIFVKTFVKLFIHKKFDPDDREMMKARREALFSHFEKIKVFEEPVHATKLFSSDSTNTPIKTLM